MTGLSTMKTTAKETTKRALAAEPAIADTPPNTCEGRRTKVPQGRGATAAAQARIH